MGVDNKKVKKKPTGQEKKESKNKLRSYQRLLQLAMGNLQVDVFHQTYHLNQGRLEEDHRGVRKMRFQTCPPNQRNLEVGLKRRLKNRGVCHNNFLDVSLTINFVHRIEEWKKMHVVKLKFLRKETEFTRDQAKLKLESNMQTFSPIP